MAMPKPIRLLAAATMALFLFLVVQIMRSPTTVKLPGLSDGNVGDMVRDPNLDGIWSREQLAMQNERLTA